METGEDYYDNYANGSSYKEHSTSSLDPLHKKKGHLANSNSSTAAGVL